MHSIDGRQLLFHHPVHSQVSDWSLALFQAALLKEIVKTDALAKHTTETDEKVLRRKIQSTKLFYKDFLLSKLRSNSH